MTGRLPWTPNGWQGCGSEDGENSEGRAARLLSFIKASPAPARHTQNQKDPQHEDASNVQTQDHLPFLRNTQA